MSVIVLTFQLLTSEFYLPVLSLLSMPYTLEEM